MPRKASQFQKRVMSLGYRGKEVFKPLNTGWIDEHVACMPVSGVSTEVGRARGFWNRMAPLYDVAMGG